MSEWFDPALRYSVVHDETGRECSADADWLNTIRDVRARWKRDGWTIIDHGLACQECVERSEG